MIWKETSCIAQIPSQQYHVYITVGILYSLITDAAPAGT